MSDLIAVPTNSAIKRLKWVVGPDGKVGVVDSIYPDLDPGGNPMLVAKIHQVNSLGETIAVVATPVNQCRIATYAEIPQARRLSLTPAYAATLGYL
jgi:hypothetical protein